MIGRLILEDVLTTANHKTLNCIEEVQVTDLELGIDERFSTIRDRFRKPLSLDILREH